MFSECKEVKKNGALYLVGVMAHIVINEEKNTYIYLQSYTTSLAPCKDRTKDYAITCVTS